MWRRRAFNLFALPSLLLCATLLVLGARDRDQFVFTADRRLYWIMVGGSVGVLTVYDWPDSEKPRWFVGSGDAPLVSIEGAPLVKTRWGIVIERVTVSTMLDDSARPMPIAVVDARARQLRRSPLLQACEVSVPTWMAVLATAALPAAAAAAAGGRLLSRRRKARLGLCRACGYDLRGNVSGVCPECGAGPPAEGVA